MKKLILCPLLLMAVLMARGQEYIPLLDENKVWSIGHEKHTLMGDTIINETTYKKLYFHNYLQEFTPEALKYIAALREDINSRKVYLIWNGYDKETLLYDFSVVKGESFETGRTKFNFWGPVFVVNNINKRQFEVMKVTDSIVAGKNRKVIKLILPNYYDTDYWLEGIGSTFGIIYPGFEMIPDREYPVLLCLHENNQLIYQQNDPFGIYVDTCYAVPLVNTRDFSKDDFTISVTPTYFQEKFEIQSETLLHEISIYNLSGNKVYQHYLSDPITQISISTSYWQSGLYIVRARNAYSYTSKKIIKP